MREQAAVPRKRRAGAAHAINWNIAAPLRVIRMIFKFEDGRRL
jgi:hypothetical protein